MTTNTNTIVPAPNQLRAAAFLMATRAQRVASLRFVVPTSPTALYNAA